MNKLIFIHGPNGVGKTSVCEAMHQRLSPSAWLESEWCRMINPFTWNDKSILLTVSNISQMLRSYLTCSWLDYVIFSYGFHGPRRQIWESVLANLQDIAYTFIPITLICDETENIIRMTRDGRDQARIQRALHARPLYEELPYPSIDTTHLTINEVADCISEIVLGYS